jgi:hypothetical protein
MNDETKPSEVPALTPRDAVRVAESLEQMAELGMGEVTMTRAQHAEFKKQLWWGRELYSPIGLRQLFPGLGNRALAIKGKK